jgi:hypothetical protein
MAKERLYKATSLRSAERMVRSLRKTLRIECEGHAKCKRELQLMAKLAATGPAFYNPLHVVAAQEIRDRILREIGLKPDGSPL